MAQRVDEDTFEGPAMGYNIDYPDPSSGEGGLSQPSGKVLRMIGQAVGLVLLLLGAFYGWSVLAATISALRDPAGLGPTLAAMATTLEMEGVTLPLGESKVPIGRTVAGVLLLLWYMLSAWVAMQLVNFGGRLVLGVIAERREFLAAMKEFLVTLRKEGSEGQHQKPGTH
jgi:hypothetical protein